MNQLVKSKDDKLKLLKALEEKKRREKLRTKLFNPHKGQLEIIQNDSHNKFVLCGNGFGKTALAANITMWHADGYNPITKSFYKVPAFISVLIDHPSKVADVWLPELRKWYVIDDEQLHKNGKPYVNEIRRPNGSRIQFFFHDQPSMVFESTEFEVVICDEPMPREIFIAMQRGMRGRADDNYFYMFGTPVSQAWIKLELHDPWAEGLLPNVAFFFGQTEDNRANLRDGYIEEFSRFLTDDEKKVRLKGNFFTIGGAALAGMFSRKDHLISKIELDRVFDYRACPCVIAIDPHPAKAITAALMGVDRTEQIYYLDEYGEKAVARVFIRNIADKWLRKYKVLDIVCDSLGNMDTTGGEGFRSFIDVCNDELRKMNLPNRVRATTYDDKSDTEFIDRIKSSLLIENTKYGPRPKLKIVDTCFKIIKDIENVSWQKDREGFFKDKLDIRRHDFLACLKYGLATNIMFKKGNQRPYDIIKQKGAAAYGFRKL